METITFKDGTAYEYTAVRSKGNQLIQGTMREVLDIDFSADTADFLLLKTLSQNTAALSEFTLTEGEQTFVHYNYTIPVALKQDLQANIITLSLAQMAAVELQVQELQLALAEIGGAING